MYVALPARFGRDVAPPANDQEVGLTDSVDIRGVVLEEIRRVWPSYPGVELEVVQVAAESMGATPADVREAVERVRQDEGAWGAPPYASKFRNRLVELTGMRPKRKPAKAPVMPKGYVWEEVEQEDSDHYPLPRIKRVMGDGLEHTAAARALVRQGAPVPEPDGEPLNFGALRDRWPWRALSDHELEPYFDEFPGLRPLENAKERLAALTAFLRAGTAIPDELR